MFDDDEPIEQRLFKALWVTIKAKPEVILSATPEGFEVFLKQGKKRFKLYTQRKSARVFRSPGTAINFLAEMGAERIVMEGLGHWKPDT